MSAFDVNTNILYCSVEVKTFIQGKRNCSQYYFFIKHMTHWNRQSNAVVSAESRCHYSVQKRSLQVLRDSRLIEALKRSSF